MAKEILLPSTRVLNEYYAIESILTALIDTINGQNKSLASFRDILLPKLMSGEIDVSNIAV